MLISNSDSTHKSESPEDSPAIEIITPKPASSFLGDTARELASTIYNYSEQCLMAHSVRAAKEYLRKELKFPHFLLVVEVEDGVQSRFNRMSWTSVLFNKAFIFVDAALDRDQKRMCIAHELFHVLHSMRHYREEGKLPEKANSADGMLMEHSCDLFAHQLCEKHNAFYAEPRNITDYCLFKTFPRSRND